MLLTSWGVDLVKLDSNGFTQLDNFSNVVLSGKIMLIYTPSDTPGGNNSLHGYLDDFLTVNTYISENSFDTVFLFHQNNNYTIFENLQIYGQNIITSTPTLLKNHMYIELQPNHYSNRQ